MPRSPQASLNRRKNFNCWQPVSSSCLSGYVRLTCCPSGKLGDMIRAVWLVCSQGASRETLLEIARTESGIRESWGQNIKAYAKHVVAFVEMLLDTGSIPVTSIPLCFSCDSISPRWIYPRNYTQDTIAISHFPSTNFLFLQTPTWKFSSFLRWIMLQSWCNSIWSWSYALRIAKPS